MTEEQFKEVTDGTVEERDVNARQVSNGFVLVGQRRFLNPTTKVVVLTIAREGIATNTSAAVESLNNFLTTGEF